MKSLWKAQVFAAASFVSLGCALILAPSNGAAFSGQLKSATDYYPEHVASADPVTKKDRQQADVVPYVSLELSEKLKFSKALRLQIRALGLANTASTSAPEKLYGDLPEVFLEYKLGDFKFRGGMNTINWGVVDISSPSDVVNTTALFHPLRPLKRGAPMLEAQWGNEAFGIHALFIPRQQAPLLPSRDSHWLPRQFLVNLVAEDTRILLPDFIEYNYGPTVVADRALDANSGVKLNSHLGRWDFQLTHFDGAATSPKVHSTIYIDATRTDGNAYALSPITLAPFIYRVRTTGFGATWAREKWIWRAETAYQHSQTVDPTVQPWMWMNVLGLETNSEVGSTTMTWLAQVYYTKNPQAPDNLISSSYRLFDRTALLGARWAYSDDLTITASLIYDTEDRGLFAMAAFEQKLNDSLKWGLAWRDFSAAREGLLKTYQRNDHASLDLTYYF